MEGFGQTETALIVANLAGMRPKVGSMGKPVPGLRRGYCGSRRTRAWASARPGEIVVRLTGRQAQRSVRWATTTTKPAGRISTGTAGLYHTGDTAWRDEDGYYWYVGRVDDLIKSSGYRIGPFEIESVIMELPYVLECGVSAAPDEIRGQVVKATIVLVKGKEPTEALKKEIQDYVKHRTAPYKYPRIVVFRDELPKTISGKIQRNLL